MSLPYPLFQETAESLWSRAQNFNAMKKDKRLKAVQKYQAAQSKYSMRYLVLQKKLTAKQGEVTKSLEAKMVREYAGEAPPPIEANSLPAELCEAFRF